MAGGEAFDEKEIIRKVLAGSRDEFSRLVSAYQNQVYALIQRQVANPEVAKELAQETFIRAYRSLGQFQGRSSFGTWLTRIALNRTNSHFASRAYKQGSRTTSMETEQGILEISAEGGSPESKLLVQALRSQLSALPQSLREAIVLCCFEGKGYAEAAEILEVPVGTVSSRLNRGMCLLRDALKGGAS